MKDNTNSLAESQQATSELHQKVAQHLSKLMRERLSHPWNIDELVMVSGYSRRNLTEIFRKVMGVSLMAYLRGLRLEEAKRLLETTDLTVRAIGERIGYRGGAFERHFMSTYGASPRAHRLRARQAESPPATHAA